MRSTRLFHSLAKTLALPLFLAPVALGPVAALAQTSPPASTTTPAPAPTQPSPDTVIARVNGEDIRLGEAQAAAAMLPPELRNTPPQMLFPLVVDQLIAQKSILLAARAEKLDQDPAVKLAMQRAADEQLQQALLRREVAPAITEDALRQRYQADIAGKPGEEEVHARHILVKTEAEAKKVLAEVSKPRADFAAVAKKMSTGPGTEQGGDLGFFKREDMVPEFAAAAFAMKPGEVSKTPVKTAFGFHIIKVEERRSAPVPTFEESHDQLRQAAFEEAINGAVAKYQAAVKVERFNMDGTPREATPAPATPRP